MKVRPAPSVCPAKRDVYHIEKMGEAFRMRRRHEGRFRFGVVVPEWAPKTEAKEE